MENGLDEIFNTLEMLVNGSNPTNYIMGDEPKMKQRYDAFIEAKQALQSYIDTKVIEAQINQISDFIIECYDHDNPIEIAKELENTRRQLEAELKLKGERHG